MTTPLNRHLLSTARDLGTWLYRYRVMSFMTQREMSAEYGIPRSTYSMWELGEVLPTPDHMAALCGYHPEHQAELMLHYARQCSLRDAHQAPSIDGKPGKEAAE